MVIDKTYVLQSPPNDKQVMYEIADGLAFIHSKKISHRDIKPDNILFSKDNHIRLGDFDRSKKMGEKKEISFSAVSGTRLWIAPEIIKITNKQKKGNEISFKVAKKSDIFSVGCVFFVYATRDLNHGGIHPFGNSDEGHRNIQENKPVNISSKSDGYAIAYECSQN